MATVNLCRANVSNSPSASPPGQQPVLRGRVLASENITSSASSQLFTDNATGENDEFIRVTTSGGAVYISVGSSPTAAVGTDFLLVDGGEIFLSVQSGDRVAVIDA